MTEFKIYRCKRCGKTFKAVTRKTDNRTACPYCPGIGFREKLKSIAITERGN